MIMPEEAVHLYVNKGYKVSDMARLFDVSEQAMSIRLERSADNKDLSGTLTNALTNGVITEGELAALQGGTFLRADLAYVSFIMSMYFFTNSLS